jgi:hypothetical protein
MREMQVLSLAPGPQGHELIDCVCQLDLAPFDALIWPHLVFA